MNPLLVLVMLAQIGTAHTITFHCTDLIDTTTVIYCESHELPISTRRVEPLVVEPRMPMAGNCWNGFEPVRCGPEPLDVPAVQRYVHVKDIIPDVCRVFEIAGDKTEMAVCNIETKWYGCDDPRRVLLTAENGTRHCVLFEGAR